MPGINIKLKPDVINAKYRPYLIDYQRRYEVYYGGAGSGKSHFIAQKLIVKALNKKRKIQVVRKVAATLRDSCFQLCLDTLSKFKLLPYCVVNLTNLTITLPNGSKLLFRGLDDVEKLKSIAGITDIWLEEATEAFLDDFAQLDLRLRAKMENLQFFLSFNPVSKANWVYGYFFGEGVHNVSLPTGNRFILHTTYKDNAFLPETYVKTLEAMEASNPTYYRIYALGEFASLDKLVYIKWQVQEFDLKQVPGQTIVGLDFGYVNDETALIWGKVDEDSKTVYIAGEVYQTGMLNDAIARQIQYQGLSKEIIIADSAEQKSIEEIRRLNVPRIKPAVKGQGSVLQGIQLLQQYRLVVHPACVNVKLEQENYSWEKDKATGEYVNKPIDKYNHLMDALRYSLQVLDNNQRLQTMPKAVLGL